MMTDPAPSPDLPPSTRFINSLCGLYRASRGRAVADCRIAREIMAVSPSTLSNWTRSRHPANQLGAVIRLMLELPPEDVATAVRDLRPRP
jgi:uncharacterized protein (DUF3820 family)